MNPLLTPMATGQEIAFWFIAPIAILGALGVVLARRPVHAALSLAVVMLSLACAYASLDAPFLFAIQIIVYTGAILMLFLFVMMLVGVDTADSMVETIKGHRVATILVVVGLVLLVVGAIGGAVVGDPVGLDEATAKAGGNIPGLAALIFGRYFFIFEGTAALLITAAIGAMVLAHGEKLRPKPSQKLQLRDRMRAYTEQGISPAPKPGPGVFARNNSVGAPGLLPDGSVAADSLPAPMADRNAVLDGNELAASTEHAHQVIVQAITAEED